jgi:hypothetical protein
MENTRSVFLINIEAQNTQKKKEEEPSQHYTYR